MERDQGYRSGRAQIVRDPRERDRESDSVNKTEADRWGLLLFIVIRISLPLCVTTARRILLVVMGPSQYICWCVI